MLNKLVFWEKGLNQDIQLRNVLDGIYKHGSQVLFKYYAPPVKKIAPPLHKYLTIKL